MANSQVQQSKFNGSKPELHIDEFFEFISQCCSTEGYKGVRSLYQENQNLKTQLKGSEDVYNKTRLSLSDHATALSEKSKQLNQVQEGIAGIESRASEWKKKYEDLEEVRRREGVEFARLKKIADAQPVIKKERDDLVEKLESLKKSLQAKDTALRQATSEKAVLDNSLKALRLFGIEMQSFDAMKIKVTSSLNSIKAAALQFAKDFLFQDLDPSFFHEWEALRQHLDSKGHLIPLPASNSLVAKQMRMAVGLAVLGKALQEHIFQPLYLGHSSVESTSFLQSLRQKDDSHEIYVRSILLKAHPELQKRCGEVRATYAVQEVMRVLEEVVPTDKLQECQAEVRRISADALQTWLPLQRIKEQIVADFNFDIEGPQRGHMLELPGIAQAQKHPKAKVSATASGMKNGKGTQKQGKDEESDSDDSDDLETYEVWPAFLADEVPFLLGLFLVEKQTAPAAEEIKRERRASKNQKKGRQGSEANGTRLISKLRNSDHFLGSGNGTSAGSN
ncbi:hypothetical protein S7711_08273 [Stachybotrys chartarum IBT 7711]|uniref:MEI5 protein n=1 Tax=Stachybotrys chartarum (strain CBS 109288 / IBT 7711) TaxID=1280523 RepID=A0A084AQM1_STACB|nr:hypothetical protein S7711_08273 [Stachybotrys chartarum IBT 7711]